MAKDIVIAVTATYRKLTYLDATHITPEVRKTIVARLDVTVVVDGSENRATTATDLTNGTSDGSRIGEGLVVEDIIVSELGALL